MHCSGGSLKLNTSFLRSVNIFGMHFFMNKQHPKWIHIEEHVKSLIIQFTPTAQFSLLTLDIWMHDFV